MRWLDTPASWNWFMECWQQIYRTSKVTKEDVFAFPFSFGPFIGFWAAFDGAQSIQNLSLTMGGMTSEALNQTDYRDAGDCCLLHADLCLATCGNRGATRYRFKSKCCSHVDRRGRTGGCRSRSPYKNRTSLECTSH